MMFPLLARMLFHAPEPTTGAGVRLVAMEPVPNWPTRFSPQQTAVLSVRNPQVNLPPLLTLESVVPPAATVGVAPPIVLPFPYWPNVLFPQQYAVPLRVRPQVWMTPALICSKVSPPETGMGTEDSAMLGVLRPS